MVLPLPVGLGGVEKCVSGEGHSDFHRNAYLMRVCTEIEYLGVNPYPSWVPPPGCLYRTLQDTQAVTLASIKDHLYCLSLSMLTATGE